MISSQLGYKASEKSQQVKLQDKNKTNMKPSVKAVKKSFSNTVQIKKGVLLGSGMATAS